jgi:hypothetical protein
MQSIALTDRMIAMVEELRLGRPGKTGAAMSKPTDGLERKIRSRPGAAERINARTDTMRSVLLLAEQREKLGKTRSNWPT